MRRLILPLLAAFALAGCSSSDDEPEYAPAIHIESSESSRLFGTEIELPVIHQRCRIIGQPVVPEGNFMGTDVMNAVDAYMTRQGLLVQVDAKAAAQVYNISCKAHGKRLILLVNGKPVGFCLINEPIRGGDIFFDLLIESPTGLPLSENEQFRANSKLSNDLNLSILKIRKAKEKNKN